MSLDESFGARAVTNAGERLIEASRGFGEALREATTRMSNGASAGADYARGLGEDVYTESRRAVRSTRKLVEQRPLEAVLIVGLASFAIGWVLRRLREPAALAPPAAARSPRAPRRRTQ